MTITGAYVPGKMRESRSSSSVRLRSSRRRIVASILSVAMRVRGLEEKLLLVKEHLSLAEATNSADAPAFRVELAPLEAAIEAVRRLAMESAATMPNQSIG